jgi:hypothetical protein
MGTLMIAAQPLEQKNDPPTMPLLSQMMVSQTRQLMDNALGFRRWTHDYLVVKEPDPQTLVQYETLGKWTLRLLRMAHVSISDPEFPDKTLLRELELLLWQLNEQWEMLHNHPPDQEVEKLYAQVFTA